MNAIMLVMFFSIALTSQSALCMTGPAAPAGAAKKAAQTPSGDDLVGPLSDLSMGTAPAGEDKSATDNKIKWRLGFPENALKRPCCRQKTTRISNIMLQTSKMSINEDPGHSDDTALTDLIAQADEPTKKLMTEDEKAFRERWEQDVDFRRAIDNPDAAEDYLNKTFYPWLMKLIGGLCKHSAEDALPAGAPAAPAKEEITAEDE